MHRRNKVSGGVPSHSLSLVGAPANARLGGELSLARHAGKGGDCLAELADRQNYVCAFQSKTHVLVKPVAALFVFSNFLCFSFEQYV